MKIKGNPEGSTYDALIDELVAASESMQWMIRPDVPRDPEVMELLHEFHAHLLGARELFEWSDVKVTSGKPAMLYIYESSPQLAEDLKQTARKLYDWRQPALPEDLTFFREEGENVLFEMTSEEETARFVELTEEEQKRFFAIEGLQVETK